MSEVRSIRRVLIANRGEIAVRVIRTCNRLGIETVLAASEADLSSMPARLADRAICIGPAPSARSYLNIEAIVEAARAVQADAVHPGYGFLSENARFARALSDAGIVFIGPPEQQLQAIGDKLAARRHAIAAGLPVVPGDLVSDADEASKLAEGIGYPVLVKAVAGGGGRGMKQVHDPARMKESVELAMSEAEAAIGESRVYVERFVASGRHVEVQVLGDGRDVIHLGDRDCSIQRRYQKLVEEAPAPNLDAKLRQSMHEAAVRFARHLGYRGAGTVEMLVDCQRHEFYFLEMNARIQVEHPVTEMITGVDLVAAQIEIAEGRPLRWKQPDVSFSGHAIECRINAEDVEHDFRPTPGTVTGAAFPVGSDIRVDTHMAAGASVPPFYDSLIAKVIARGPDRAAALARMRVALSNCRVEGVPTNLGVHRALMQEREFTAGGVDTAYFARFLQRSAAHG
jgi:acetyl-CoA carboxylase biotin carboxylase subunit